MAEKKKGSDPPPPTEALSSSDSDDEPPPKPKPGPIIGPDGKEIPRPTDKDGNPLPVYVSPEGKPILDDAGKPVVVRVDENGKPIPYHDLLAYQQSNQGMVQEQEKETKMSKSYIYVGVGDFIISLAFSILAAAYLGPAASKYKSDKSDQNYEEYLHSLITLIVEAIGAASAFLVIIAGYANKRGFFYGWIIMCTILIIPLVAIVSYGSIHFDPVAFPAMLHCILRGLLICCCAMTMGMKDKDKDKKYQAHPVSSQLNGSYPVQRGGGGGGTQTVIIRQQPQTTYVRQAPVIVHHAPMYGYGYGYPYYGYGYHPADSLAMGMMAGAMMGGYGYDYGYDYGW